MMNLMCNNIINNIVDVILTQKRGSLARQKDGFGVFLFYFILFYFVKVVILEMC